MTKSIEFWEEKIATALDAKRLLEGQLKKQAVEFERRLFEEAKEKQRVERAAFLKEQRPKLPLPKLPPPTIVRPPPGPPHRGDRVKVPRGEWDKKYRLWRKDDQLRNDRLRVIHEIVHVRIPFYQARIAALREVTVWDRMRRGIQI